MQQLRFGDIVTIENVSQASGLGNIEAVFSVPRSGHQVAVFAVDKIKGIFTVFASQAVIINHRVARNGEK